MQTIRITIIGPAPADPALQEVPRRGDIVDKLARLLDRLPPGPKAGRGSRVSGGQGCRAVAAK